MKLLTRRRLALLGIAVLALPLVAGLFLHFHGRSQLANYRRQLVAQGERLLIEELIPETVPAAVQTAQTLRFNGVILAEPLSMMVGVAPGRCYAVWKQSTISGRTAEAWTSLAGEVRVQQRALADVRSALATSPPDWQPNYQGGFSIVLPHLGRSKSLAQILAAEGLVKLRAGDREGAVASVHALVHLSGFSQHDRLLIGQLVANAINSIAFSACWELLQTNGWSEAQLARLQQAWEGVDPLSNIAPTLEMERAMMLQLYRQLRLSHRTFHEFSPSVGLPGAGPPPASTPPADITGYPGYFFGFLRDGAMELTRLAMSRSWAWFISNYDELAFLKHSQADLDSVRTALRQNQLARLSSTPPEEQTPTRESQPWYAIFARQVQSPAESVAAKCARARLHRDLMRTRLALERHRLAHGRLPATLEELVPTFLAAPPIDVMDNHPLRYRPTADGACALYSAGEDGRDDGGDPTPRAPKSTPQRGSPSFFRPAKDIVWPAEADAVETAAALEHAAKRR